MDRECSDSRIQITSALWAPSPTWRLKEKPTVGRLTYINGRYILAIVALQEPTFFAMVALLDGPLHGYAIIQRSELLSHGRVRLNAGTLYTALDRLLAAGMVEVVREEIVSGRARRAYALTGTGRNLISQEGRRHAEAARLVTKRSKLRRIGGLA